MHAQTVRQAARRAQRGMTLLEIMIVIAILALVAGAVGFAVMGQFERAKVKTAKLEINEIMKKLNLYMVDNDSNPPEPGEGLKALTKATPPYLKDKDLKDPWGQEYVYFNPAKGGGEKFEVVSKGPDKQEGTEDDIRVEQ